MAVVNDAQHDFIPVYTGPPSTTPAGAAVDVKTAEVIYDAAAHTFTVTATMWGPISAVAGVTGFAYVWGFDRGQGTERFVNNTATSTGVGVLFDSVVNISPTGAVTINRIVGGPAATVLPAGSATISGDTITFVLAASALPSLGLTFADYDWNLWPRAFGGNAGISDFAPNDGGPDAVINVTIVNADEVRYVVHEDAFEDGARTIVRLDADDISGRIAAWALVDAAESPFTIDRATGELSFKQEPDDDKSYTAFVAATGVNGQVETQEITIAVQDGGNLRGKAGVSDHFVFGADLDKETIKGFEAGSGPNHDVLEIDRALVGNISEQAFLDALQASDQHGRNTEIDLGGSGHHDAEIRLKGVSVGSLTVENFHFF